MEGLEQGLGRWPGTPFPSNKGRLLIHQPASQDGIKPMWEDSRNKRGGRWLVSLTKQQRHIELDHLWLETVSGGVGRRLGGEGSQGKRLGWCGSSGLKDGGGSLCPPGGLIPLLLGSSCCVSSGRALGSTARKYVGPSSTSEPRGTRLLCGHGRQRTRKACYTLGEGYLWHRVGAEPLLGEKVEGEWLGLQGRPLEYSMLSLPSFFHNLCKGCGV